MGFLMKFIPGGWVLYAILAAAVFASGAASGFWAKGKLDVPVIASLKVDVATSQLDAQKARTALAEQQEATAAEVARSDAAALAQRTQDAARAADLGARLARSDAARRDASLKLLDTLKVIPHDQQTALPASVRQYLDGVRDAQAAGP